jgi:hypothetical protein
LFLLWFPKLPSVAHNQAHTSMSDGGRSPAARCDVDVAHPTDHRVGPHLTGYRSRRLVSDHEPVANVLQAPLLPQ